MCCTSQKTESHRCSPDARQTSILWLLELRTQASLIEFRMRQLNSMTQPWTERLAGKLHPLVLPVVWITISISYFYILLILSDGQSLFWHSPRQFWGTALVYCMLPGYLWYCGFYLYRATDRAFDELTDLVPRPDQWLARIQSPPARYMPIWMILGGLYGLSQNRILVENFDLSGNPWLDGSMMVVNMIMFTTIGAVLGRRLYAHAGFLRMGFEVKVDLYNLRTLRPFANVALTDVLVVMGAVAFMPLQSLDAEFRWVNYEAGLAIGIPSAIAFLVLPLWGVHQNIRTQQRIRLDEIQAAVNGCDREDIATLEKVVAHRDRIQTMNTWPVDLRLLYRAAFYLIIPPLAWVGAALVENLVEQTLK
jgi:hypothetical protein